MPPAIIAGGIAAAGTIGGAVLSSKAQNKAASQANQAEQQATQAQLQLGRESLGLNKDIYNSNYNTLSPFVSRGNVAGTAINALLGLPDAPAMTSPLGGGAQQAAGVQQAPVASQTPLNTVQGITALARQAHGGGLQPMIGQNSPGINRGIDYTLPSMGPQVPGNSVPGASTPIGTTGGAGGIGGGATMPPATGGAQPPAPAQTPGSAYNAMNDFANSAGMQFQLDQGAREINNNYAAHGALQSGAAMKALQDYGQHTALNNYFMPYMGLLGGQQAVGAGAASSIAGVGANFGNTAAAINGQMGNSIQGGADAAANAALIRGQNNANMIGSIGSALGSFGSSFFPHGGY